MGGYSEVASWLRVLMIDDIMTAHQSEFVGSIPWNAIEKREYYRTNAGDNGMAWKGAKNALIIKLFQRT